MLNNADKQLCDIMLGAEKKLPCNHGTYFSPRYAETIRTVQKKRSTLTKAQRIYEVQPTLENGVDLYEAMNDLEEAKEELEETNENSATIRQAYLIELAEAYHQSGTFKTLETSIKVLLHIEKQKEDAKKIRNTLKSSVRTSLSYVLIPCKSEYPPHLQPFYKDPLVMWNRIEEDCGEDIKNWEAITERQELEQLLLEWQCLHFTQAQDTPLASATWEKIIMTSDTVDTLRENYKEEYESLEAPSKAFIEELFKEQPCDDQHFSDMKLEDFRQYILKKDESTSSSPSGRHLGHLKTIVDHPMLSYIFRLIQLSLSLGYIPERWRRTVTVLIEKKAGSPKIHRLRTIHLVEPEVQFLSNFYWSKRFLRFCELQENHLTPNQYGARKETLAASAIVRTQVQWDISRMNNIPLASHLADARANFDRNLSHIVGKALLKRGFPKRVVRYYRDFLNLQIFLIRTGYGISEGTYQRSPDNLIYGDCQGLAWSAINQLVISTVIDNVYHQLSSKFLFSSHDRQLIVESGVNYFVDDRITNSMTMPEEDESKLFQITQQNEVIQTEQLNCAGGALAPKKCGVWFLTRRPGDTAIHYKTDHTFPGEMYLRSTGAKEKIKIERLAPNAGQRYLGAVICPTMNPLSQISALENIISKWSSSINHGRLAADLVLKSTYTNLNKQLEWPLVASDLSFAQADTLTGKIRPVVTRRQRLHSCTARAVVHGPLDLGGLDFYHIYDIQGQAKLSIFKRHMLAEKDDLDILCKLFHISLGDHMLWLGQFTNFFQIPFEKWGFLLAQRSWLSSLWKYLSYRGLLLDVLHLPSYILPKEKDRFIMNLLLLEGNYDEKTLLIFNRVRMHYNLLSLSDLVLEDGRTIHRGYLKGTPTSRVSSFQWPRPEHIKRSWFILFRKILGDFINRYLGSHPLGNWVSKPHMEPSARKLSDDLLLLQNKLYSRSNTGSFRFHSDCSADAEQGLDTVDVYYEKGIMFQYVTKKVPHLIPAPIFDNQCTLLDRAPKWMRDLWGFKPITDDMIEHLLIQLQKPFIMATDGGGPKNKPFGTYSYLFCGKDNSLHYENFGITQVAPDQSASVRFEGFAMLAGITLLNFLGDIAFERGIKLTPPLYRVFSCDNEEISKLHRKTVKPKNYYKRPHSDVVLQLLHEWKKSDLHPSSITWVRSHADRRKPPEQWTQLERLNIQADFLCHEAEKFADAHCLDLSAMAPCLPLQVVSLRNDCRRFICEHTFKLHHDRAYASLREYMISHRYAPRFDFDRIDWISVKSVMRQASPAERIKFTKVIHEKWITLEQQYIMNNHASGVCALCRTDLETHRHIFVCKDARMINQREAQYQQFYNLLLKWKTPMPLAQFFLHMLRSPTIAQFNSNSGLLGALPQPLLTLIDRACISQRKIGWLRLHQGFLARDWTLVMETYFRYYKFDDLIAGSWAAKVVRSLLRTSIEIWNRRCKLLQPTEETYISSIRTQATEELQRLKTSPHLIGIYRGLIRHPPKYFMRASKSTIVTWTADIKNALKHTTEHNKQKKFLITRFAITPDGAPYEESPRPSTRPSRDHSHVYRPSRPRLTQTFLTGNTSNILTILRPIPQDAPE